MAVDLFVEYRSPHEPQARVRSSLMFPFVIVRLMVRALSHHIYI